jgi:MinD superfamily P-loop ATPase
LKEIVFISGKGGTGKTSILSSIIPFMPKAIIADCDVDAPDLHILLDPEELTREDFTGMKKARIDENRCTACGKCAGSCRFNAIDLITENKPVVRDFLCEGCGVCAYVCPVEAVKMEDAVVGTLSRSTTAYGPMVHARLAPGEETSGKLVFAVREKSRELAGKMDACYILVDGSPGIGCSVISSLTNSGQAVIVTESSISAYHDLLRVFDLVEQLSIPVSVVINKFDLSKELTDKIEVFCESREIPVVLKLPFNEKMIAAITAKKIPSLALNDFFFENGFDGFLESLK